jgi:hypothetical protein
MPHNNTGRNAELTEAIETAKGAALNVQRVNLLPLVMESRGVHMSADPADVKKFGDGLLKFNDQILAVVKNGNPSSRSMTANTALWLNVDALVQSCVFLPPTSLVDEKPPQLFMRLHPKHRIDPVFLKHRVPGGLIDLHFDQLEIIT